MSELTIVHWGFLVLGAIIMGLSKGGIPGAGNLTVALFVLVLEDALGPVGVGLSVGLLLPVLISADLVSTMVYRKYVEWSHVGGYCLIFYSGSFWVGGHLTFFSQQKEPVRSRCSSVGFFWA